MPINKKSAKKVWKLCGVSLLCCLLNLGGMHLATVYHLPFWLDTLGVLLAAHYTNLPLTLLTLLLPDLLLLKSLPQLLYYIPANLLLAAAIYLSVKRGYLKTLSSATMSGFVVGLMTSLLYLPFDLRLNGGLTLNLWGDALSDMLHFYGAPPMLCVLAAEGIVNIIDKQLCFFLAFCVIALLDILKEQSRRPMRSSIGVLLLIPLLLQGLLLPARAVPSEEESTPEKLSNYVQTIYDNTSGLPSTSVNVVAATPDGAIWVGGYAGLCRCDGTSFRYIVENGHKPLLNHVSSTSSSCFQFSMSFGASIPT